MRRFRENVRITPGLFKLVMCLVIIPGPLIVCGVFGYGIYQQLYLGEPWGDSPMSDGALVGMSAGLLAFVLGSDVVALMLLRNLRYEITVTSTHLDIQSFPMGSQRIALRDIAACEVQTGLKGRGVQWKLGKGWCYNLAGSTGVRIELKGNRQVIIGTHRAAELKDALVGADQDRNA